MQSIKEVEEQEWTEKGTIISISGKRKSEKHGANIRRANDEKAFGGEGCTVVGGVRAVGTR
jgi:hypothetical protein